jgi:alkylhydroperoxidase family enzyme
MGRIRTLESHEVDGEARAIYDEFHRQRGNVPNMMKTLAHKPRLLKTGTEHFKAVMAPGEVDTKLKEMVAVRVSTLNQCDY